MSVLVKGMEMPKSCSECGIKGRCFTDVKNIEWLTYHPAFYEERLTDCPLVELPPHGRLIDADALLMRINHEVMEAYMDGVCYGVHPSQEYLYLLGEIIDDAPTIIEAEGRE